MTGRGGERGETLVMSVILLTALLVSITTLISASEQWEARRKAAAAATTMARSAAQGDPILLRQGATGLDPAVAQRRVDAVLAALNGDDTEATYEGRITALHGLEVATEATVSIRYTFPLPGFPDRVSGTATAEAVLGGP
jgi:Flp pilus assembly protein TadG